MLVPKERTCFVQKHNDRALAQGLNTLLRPSESSVTSSSGPGLHLWALPADVAEMFDLKKLLPLSHSGRMNQALYPASHQQWRSECNPAPLLGNQSSTTKRYEWRNTEKSTEPSLGAGKGFPVEVTPQLKLEGWLEVDQTPKGKKSVLCKGGVVHRCHKRREGSFRELEVRKYRSQREASGERRDSKNLIPWSEHKGLGSLVKWSRGLYLQWKPIPQWQWEAADDLPVRCRKDTIHRTGTEKGHNNFSWLWIQCGDGMIMRCAECNRSRRKTGPAWGGWEGSQRMMNSKGHVKDVVFSAIFLWAPLILIHYIPVDLLCLENSTYSTSYSCFFFFNFRSTCVFIV